MKTSPTPLYLRWFGSACLCPLCSTIYIVVKVEHDQFDQAAGRRACPNCEARRMLP